MPLASCIKFDEIHWNTSDRRTSSVSYAYSFSRLLTGLMKGHFQSVLRQWSYPIYFITRLKLPWLSKTSMISSANMPNRTDRSNEILIFVIDLLSRHSLLELWTFIGRAQ